jgi:DNA gyrase subunit A
VNDGNELLLISDGGTMVRTRVAEVSVTGRNAQGVMLIRLDSKETLVGVVCIEIVCDDDADDAVLDMMDGHPVEVDAFEGEPDALDVDAAALTTEQ